MQWLITVVYHRKGHDVIITDIYEGCLEGITSVYSEKDIISVIALWTKD